MTEVGNQVRTIHDSFRLAKLKLRDDLGLEITFLEKAQQDENIIYIEKTWKSSIHRHPDMDKAMDKLKPHIARIYGIMAVGLYKDESLFNDQEKKLWEDTLESIRIVGITMNVVGESQDISIQAKRKVLGGKTIKMESPDMKFDDEVYDWCYELGEISKEISMEVFQYAFNKKYAQLELFECTDVEEDE